MHHSLYQELDLRATYLGYQDTELCNVVRNIVLFRAQPRQSSRINQSGRTLKTTFVTVPLVADLSVLIRNPCWLFDKFGQWALPTTHWLSNIPVCNRVAADSDVANDIASSNRALFFTSMSDNFK